jgi:hypothetical protein
MYAIDFGTGDALAIYRDGIVQKPKLPRQKGGKTVQQEFIFVLDHLLQTDDVVFESATIGASGCEAADIIELLERHPDRSIYTISCRAIKNYRLDNKYNATTDPKLRSQDDARIIYEIATNNPRRIRRWEALSPRVQRVHRSVRPMDKRGYRDDRAIGFMNLLPPYHSLPDELRGTLGDGKKYHPSVVMPFAMATTEPYLIDGDPKEMRARYEHIIGLSENGYPSFYRRATVVWMQRNAKALAEVSRIAEVDPQTRKAAWRRTQRQIRHFFHLTMQHQGYTKAIEIG